MRKDMLLAQCDYLTAQGYERATLLLKLREMTKHTEEMLKTLPLAERLLQVERSYEDLCYQIMRMQGKINNVSMPVREVQRLTVYELYTLKTKLEDQK